MIKLSHILDANVMRICNKNSTKYQLLKKTIDVNQYSIKNAT
jgi:hypothetical protein